MKKDNSLELRRQMFHLFLGLAMVALLVYDILNREIILVLTLIGIVFSIASKYLQIPVISWFLQRFERKEDLRSLPGRGMIYFFIGSYFSLLLFSKEIALASIMILTLGDSLSHLAGIHLGRVPHPLSDKKFLEGAFVGFVAGFIGAYVFLPALEASFAALVAMIVEGIEVKIGNQRVNDNLVVPVVAGAVVWLMRTL